MKRKLILTLTVLLVFTALGANNQPLIPTAHAESDQCPVIRQVCKEMWDRMYTLCRLDGVIQEQCDAIRAVSYGACVIQTAKDIGTVCSLKDEFIVY